jgi:hypothetical protein
MEGSGTGQGRRIVVKGAQSRPSSLFLQSTLAGSASPASFTLEMSHVIGSQRMAQRHQLIPPLHQRKIELPDLADPSTWPCGYCECSQKLFPKAGLSVATLTHSKTAQCTRHQDEPTFYLTTTSPSFPNTGCWICLCVSFHLVLLL